MSILVFIPLDSNTTLHDCRLAANNYCLIVDTIQDKHPDTFSDEVHKERLKPTTSSFVSNNPAFIDCFEPTECYVVDKNNINLASNYPIVQNMVSEGLGLGGLWLSGYLT